MWIIENAFRYGLGGAQETSKEGGGGGFLE